MLEVRLKVPIPDTAAPLLTLGIPKEKMNTRILAQFSWKLKQASEPHMHDHVFLNNHEIIRLDKEIIFLPFQLFFLTICICSEEASHEVLQSQAVSGIHCFVST